MCPVSGVRNSRAIVSSVEWILKKALGPDRWRPAGAVKVLPPSALVHDVRESRRAEEVFRLLTRLGFQPTMVPVDSLAEDAAGTWRSIASGAEGCWAAVVLDPEDRECAKRLGPAFREFAHRYPDTVAIVVGPLPSHSEILDRYRHVVTAADGSVSDTGLAAGLAHASSARVLHSNRLLNACVTFFSIVIMILLLALVVVLCVRRG